jgi:hypothetical protein
MGFFKPDDMDYLYLELKVYACNGDPVRSVPRTVSWSPYGKPIKMLDRILDARSLEQTRVVMCHIFC